MVRAQVSLPDTVEKTSTPEVVDSAELPLTQPSLIPEVVSFGEFEQSRPRKWGRIEEISVGGKLNCRTELNCGPKLNCQAKLNYRAKLIIVLPQSSPIRGTQSEEVAQGSKPTTSGEPASSQELSDDTSIPGFTFGHSLPPRPLQASPPCGILKQIIETEEAELKKKSMVGICDLMNAIVTKVTTSSL